MPQANDHAGEQNRRSLDDGSPAHADDVTVCLGHATVSVAGQPIVDEELGCHVVDLP